MKGFLHMFPNYLIAFVTPFESADPTVKESGSVQPGTGVGDEKEQLDITDLFSNYLIAFVTAFQSADPTVKESGSVQPGTGMGDDEKEQLALSEEGGVKNSQHVPYAKDKFPGSVKNADNVPYASKGYKGMEQRLNQSLISDDYISLSSRGVNCLRNAVCNISVCKCNSHLQISLIFC
ncbi:unnamed protein product [Trichobilharzia szidati]|nr:unnamed protein product [Trichobilharzia szidati]